MAHHLQLTKVAAVEVVGRIRVGHGRHRQLTKGAGVTQNRLLTVVAEFPVSLRCHRRQLQYRRTQEPASEELHVE